MRIKYSKLYTARSRTSSLVSYRPSVTGSRIPHRTEVAVAHNSHAANQGGSNVHRSVYERMKAFTWT